MNEAHVLFVVMAAFTVASPGPGVLMTLDNAISSGWSLAMRGVVGLAAGAAIMAGLSSAGVGMLIRSSDVLFQLLKYCGVAYLFYLAYKAWTRLPPPAGTQPAADRQAASAGDGGRPIRRRESIFLKGMLLQTSNPKSLLFFLSVLPQVVDTQGAGASSTTRLVAAIMTYCLLLILIHGIYAGAASSARGWLSRPGSMRLLSRASALMFFSFGVTMLTLKL